MNFENTKASDVWRLFQELSRIPRPSKHEQRVCNWLERFTQDHNLSYQRDQADNLVIQLPPTAGCQAAPPVILQAHTDMVCEKMPDSNHDFSQDPIRLIEKDGWLYGDRTTLGADNGIGVCMALAIAQDKALVHPALELLFTVDEETGMTGANALEAGFVNGSRLLNLDSEDEGVFTIGCAGGLRTKIELALTPNSVAEKYSPFKLSITELTGGHSGVNIHEQRANAIKVLVRALNSLRDQMSIRLLSLQAGNADNAIPRDAQAGMLLPTDQFDQARKIVQALQNDVRAEFSQTDPNIIIAIESIDQVQIIQAFDAASSAKVFDLLMALPHGVQRISTQFEGIVETSCNLAKATIDAEKNVLRVITSQRSFNQTCRDALTEQIGAVASLAGAQVKHSQGYPPWQPRQDSELLTICKNLYQDMNGQTPVVEVIHAGLECGIIESKCPGLDMISLGPTIENPHSPQERVNIDSVERVWEFLVQLLARLAGSGAAS